MAMKDLTETMQAFKFAGWTERDGFPEWTDKQVIDMIQEAFLHGKRYAAKEVETLAKKIQASADDMEILLNL